MNYHLVLITLSVSTLAHLSNACQLGSEAIQEVYDRYELFRKTKAFDPTDSKVPVLRYQYQSYNDQEVKNLALELDGVYITENFETDGDHKIRTIDGQYRVNNGVILNFKREENGEFSFDDWWHQKKFKSSLRSIDAELPSNFEEDYKQVMVDLNAMRKKMFDFQNGLSKEDLERVRLFQFNPFSYFHGFYAQYIDKDGGSLSVSKQDASDDISGLLLCDSKEQKYNIVDGKVIADGEPFVSVYH